MTTQEGHSHSRLYVGGVILLYWVVSITLVNVNKMIITKKTVPIFVTWTQCVVTCVICWVCGTLGEHMRGENKKGHENGMETKSAFAGFPKAQYHPRTALRVMPMSSVFVLMIVFNQLTLKNVEVSFYNVARSLTIVLNAVFSVVLLGARVSLRTVACLVVVIAGFLVGVGGEVKLSQWGVIYGVLASVAVSLNSIYTKKALKLVQNDAWRLTFVNNVNACILFLPLVYLFESDQLAKSLDKLLTPTFAFSVFVAGLLGFMIGIVSVMQIHVTSPLTHNISGTAKAGAQSAAAYFIWRNEATFLACLGNFLVLLGSGLYTAVKIREVQEAQQKAPTPVLPLAREPLVAGR